MCCEGRGSTVSIRFGVIPGPISGTWGTQIRLDHYEIIRTLYEGPGNRGSRIEDIVQVNLQVQHSALNDSQSAPSPRLVKASHEFEGQMMQELLKPLMNGDSLTGAGDSGADSGEGASGALGEFATEALGQAMSQHGGFGIAGRIVREITQSGNQDGKGKVTTKLHENTVMRTRQ